MYPELIVRFSLPNLTRLKYHKNCIWQFKKHNRGKKKKERSRRQTIWCAYPGMCNMLPVCAGRRPPPPACSQGRSPGAQQLPCLQEPHLGGPVGPTLPAHRSLGLSLLFLSAQYVMGFVGLGCWKTVGGSENFFSLPHEIHSKNFID